MPYRTTNLVIGEYYHIFNRGVAKQRIFKNYRYYDRFAKSMLYYQIKGPKPRFSLFAPTVHKLDWNNKIVEIICFNLMPNHFHFLLKQTKEDGISELLRKLSNSYTKYFNVKEGNRVGPLLQGQFKAVLVESNEQLLHLSRYIHLNPLVADVIDNLEKYPWSSYLEYIGLNNQNICNKEVILSQFKSQKDYKNFVLDQEGYGRELVRIEHLLVDL